MFSARKKLWWTHGLVINKRSTAQWECGRTRTYSQPIDQSAIETTASSNLIIAEWQNSVNMTGMSSNNTNIKLYLFCWHQGQKLQQNCCNVICKREKVVEDWRMDEPLTSWRKALSLSFISLSLSKHLLHGTSGQSSLWVTAVFEWWLCVFFLLVDLHTAVQGGGVPPTVHVLVHLLGDLLRVAEVRRGHRHPGR